MIFGIDLNSFSIACAIIDGDELGVAQLYATKKKPFDERFDELVPLFDNFLRKLQPEAVYIEEIPHVKGNGQHTVMVLTAVQSLIRVICVQQHIPYHLIHNLTWKKELGVKGTGPRGKVLKEDTKILVTQLYNITDELTEDQYDAIGIATSGLGRSGKDSTQITYKGIYTPAAYEAESSHEASVDEGIHSSRKKKSKEAGED